ncbi:unnamed protein product [Amoebophrya sp. A25]|nr:unnamed protein product [Amoebophrya sp. A25]|eukprot:GSA25T00011033001.1
MWSLRRPEAVSSDHGMLNVYNGDHWAFEDYWTSDRFTYVDKNRMEALLRSWNYAPSDFSDVNSLYTVSQGSGGDLSPEEEPVGASKESAGLTGQVPRQPALDTSRSVGSDSSGKSTKSTPPPPGLVWMLLQSVYFFITYCPFIVWTIVVETWTLLRQEIRKTWRKISPFAARKDYDRSYLRGSKSLYNANAAAAGQGTPQAMRYLNPRVLFFAWLCINPRFWIQLGYTIVKFVGGCFPVAFAVAPGVLDLMCRWWREVRTYRYGPGPRQTVDVYFPRGFFDHIESRQAGSQCSSGVIKFQSNYGSPEGKFGAQLRGLGPPRARYSPSSGGPGSAPGNSQQNPGQLYPVVVVVTGGAWLIGHRIFGTSLGQHLAESGKVLTVALDYQNYPAATFPEMVEDVRDGLRWVKQNIGNPEFRGDPNDITIVGQSCGSMLALLAILREDFRFQNFFGWSGVYDLPGMHDHMKASGYPSELLDVFAGDRAAGSLEDWSPLQLLAKHPLLFEKLPRKRIRLFHGMRDTTSPDAQSVYLAELLRHRLRENHLTANLQRRYSFAQNFAEPSSPSLLDGSYVEIDDASEFSSFAAAAGGDTGGSKSSDALQLALNPRKVDLILSDVYDTHTKSIVEYPLRGENPVAKQVLLLCGVPKSEVDAMQFSRCTALQTELGLTLTTMFMPF